MKKRTNGEGTIYFDEKRKLWIGQKMVNGKRKKVSAKQLGNMKEKLKNLDYSIVNNSITLTGIIEKTEKEKLSANIISEGTYYRNTATLKHIRTSDIGNLKISKITTNDLQNFLNSKLYLSQSLIDKMFIMLNNAFKRAIAEDLIIKNPIINVIYPTSDKNTKKVIAFEIWEQKQLIEYIMNNDLIGNSISKYNTPTIKNLILLGIFTGMRLGELGAIDYEKNIDFKKEYFEITRTLTKDINGRIKIGSSTKTGKLQRKQGKKDIKFIPFNSYNKDFIKTVVEEQIDEAKSNKYNYNKLLFCRSDGKPIVTSEINNIFKRICREAEVKTELITGCHFHMLRHTFATRCIEARLELLTIAKLLGHNSTEQIEKTYGHILDKFKNEELNNLQNYYGKENIVAFREHRKQA